MTDTTKARKLATTLESECIGVRVARLHRLVSRRYSTSLKPLGITLGQMEVLSALTIAEGAMKPVDLAEHLAIERSTLNRNLVGLSENGWIVSEAVSAANRTMAVAITSRGTAKLIEARAAWIEAQRGLETSVGSDAAQTLDAWNERLRGDEWDPS